MRHSQAINDDIPERDDLAKMLTGRPTALESQFRLTFTMILNLLKVCERCLASSGDALADSPCVATVGGGYVSRRDD